MMPIDKFYFFPLCIFFSVFRGNITVKLKTVFFSWCLVKMGRRKKKWGQKCKENGQRDKRRMLSV